MKHFTLVFSTRRASTLLFLLVVVILLEGLTSLASGESQNKNINSVISPSEFEKDVKDLRRKLETQGSNTDELSSLVLDRLREYRVTTDNSIIETVHAIKTFESKTQIEQNGGKVPEALKYPSTKAFIESVIPLINNNGILQSQLLSETASVLEAEGDLDNASKVLQKAADIISPVQLDGDLLRLSLYVELGDVHLRTGHKALAEEAYNYILKYGWYNIKDPVLRYRAYEMYLSAGIGLIECSRHDLKALKDIGFVPSSLEILGPILDEAVKQATDEEARPQGQRIRR